MLAALVPFALRGRQRPTIGSAALALAISIVYAFSDEWHQSMVPNRATGRLEDVVTDVTGALVGLAVAALILGSAARARTPSGQGDR